MPTTGYRTNWDEFVAPGAPVFDFIFTVSQRRWRGVPVLAGQAGIGSLGRPDPAAVEARKQRPNFKDAALILRRRISFSLAPLNA